MVLLNNHNKIKMVILGIFLYYGLNNKNHIQYKCPNTKSIWYCMSKTFTALISTPNQKNLKKNYILLQ